MDSMAQIFTALSEPVRLRILALLLDGERCVCDLMAMLEMPQSTASRHLAYLKNCGWITGERRGVWMYYRLAAADGPGGEVLAVLRSRLPATGQGTADAGRLAAYLAHKGLGKY